MVANIWIVQIMARAMAFYVPFGMEPGLCTKQGNLYNLHVTNLTFWAVQMMDSRSTGISGLLSGNRHDFGNLDQCANISVPEYNIYGRYFVVKLKFNLKNRTYNEKLEKIYRKPGPKSSVWKEFIPTMDPRINPTNEINWAICVPASCTSDDVRYSLMSKLMPALESNGIIGNLTVLDRYTYSKLDPPIKLPAGYHLFLFFVVGLITAVFLVTLYDLWHGDCTTVDRRKWFYKFSMVKNMERLIKPEQTEEFKAISGLKVISMFIIILGHRMMISLFTPLVNQRENELLIGDFIHTYIQNGTLIVNTFFEITGFLTFYKILKDIDNERPVNVFKLVGRRWMRLAPAYAFIMGLVVYVAPQLETGPIGRGVTWQPACDQYWWTNILFINNYIYPDKQCLIPSWYIASDLQLYALCSILGYILYKSRKTGLLLLGIVGILSIIIPGIVVFMGHYDGVMLLYLRNFEYYFSNKQFVETYLQTHVRASPYAIGMISAYIYYDLVKKRSLKISNFQTWLTFNLMMIMMNASILGAWVFYIPGRDYKLWEHVLYSTVHRIGWAVPIAFIIIADATTAFAPLRNTVGLRIFQFLNGLTYSALLVHTPLQLYLAGLGRSPLYYTSFICLWMSLGDIFMTYLLALALYLFVEAPMNVLQDLPSLFPKWFKGNYYYKNNAKDLKK